MGAFHKITLLPKDKKELIETVSREIESELKSSILPNSWFKFQYIGANLYFDEYFLDSVNLRDKQQDVHSRFSSKIDGFFATLETSDGENSNFYLYNKGDLIIRYSSDPGCLYNSDFFMNKENIFLESKYPDIPFLSEEVGIKLKSAFEMDLDKPYYEICRILGVKNPSYESQ